MDFDWILIGFWIEAWSENQTPLPLFKPCLPIHHVLCLDMAVPGVLYLEMNDPGAAQSVVIRKREDYTYCDESAILFRFTKEDFQRVWMAGMGVTEMGQRAGEYDATWHCLSEFTSNLVGVHSEQEKKPYGFTSLSVSADFVKPWEETFRNFKFAYPDPRLSNADRWNGFRSVQQFSFWKVIPFPLAYYKHFNSKALVGELEIVRTKLDDGHREFYKLKPLAYSLYFYDSVSAEFVVRYVGVFTHVSKRGQEHLLRDEVAVTLYDFQHTEYGKMLTSRLLDPVVEGKGFPVRMYYSYYEECANLYKFTEAQFQRVWMAGMGITDTRSMDAAEYTATWSHLAEFTSKLAGVYGNRERQPSYVVYLKDTTVCKTWNEWIDRFQFPYPDPGLMDVDRWKGFDSAEKFSFWNVMPVPISATRWLQFDLEFEVRIIYSLEGDEEVPFKPHAYMFYFYDSVASEFIVRYVGVFEPIPEGDQVPPGRDWIAVILHDLHHQEMQLTSKLLTPILQAAQGGASA